MDRWVSVLALLGVLLAAVSGLWAWRDRFQETQQSQAVVAWLGRWLQRRADTPLRKDFLIVRRVAGWIALTIFVMTLLWSSVMPKGMVLPRVVLDVFVACLIVWASLNVWIAPVRFVTHFGREFVLLPAAAPWIALALNRLLLRQWSAAPFDELMRSNPLAMLAASDGAWLVTAKISAFFLLAGLSIVLLAMLLTCAVPLMYTAVVGPPTWAVRGWMAMSDTQRRNFMLALFVLGLFLGISVAALKALI